MINLTDTESVLVRTCILGLGAPIAILTWRSAKQLGPSAPVIQATVAYVAFAYLLIGVLLSALPGDLTGTGGALTPSLTGRQEAQAMLTSGVYSITVLLGCLQLTRYWRESPKSPQENSRLETPAIVAILGTLILMKGVVNLLLGWGVPAFVPANTIPLVTGFAVYAVRDGMLVACAIALFRTARARGTRTAKFCIRALVALAVATDLLIGSKFILVGLVFLAIPTLFHVFTRQRLLMRIVSGGLALTAFCVFLIAYQAANTLRFLNLDSSIDMPTAISRSIDLSTSNLDFGRAIQAVVSRATGADGIRVATTMTNTIHVRFSDILFTSDFASRYTSAVSGVEDENLAVGATLPGTFALICDNGLTCTGATAYVVTIVFFGLVLALFRVVPLHSAVRVPTGLVLALTVVHAQLASGALVMFIGRIGTIMCIAYLFGRRLGRAPKRHRPVSPHSFG
jgi:hypothetical protein